MPAHSYQIFLRITVRDFILFVTHTVKLCLYRLRTRVRFIKPSQLPDGTICQQHEVGVHPSELPANFSRQCDSKWTRQPLVFEAEQVYSITPSSEFLIHDSRFVRSALDRYLDVGNQSDGLWPMLDHALSPRPIIRVNKVIVPWGTGSASYGDFLIHVLPKLARLLSAIPENERSEFSVCLPFFHAQPWAVEYLGMLGISKNRILDGSGAVKVPAGSTLVIGSGPQTRYGISHPKDIGQLLGQISSNLPATSGKPWRKIYVSRRIGRKMANEDALTDGLLKRDFEIVRLEEMELMNQIRLFQEAHIIVGPHGAGHANIMWSASGSHLLEVFHPSWMHPCYAFLAGFRKIHYHCLVGYNGSSRGRWKWGSYFGIFENPEIDPEILFEKIDQITTP